MAELGEIVIPHKKITDGLNLKVRIKGARSLSARIWVATRLIALAAGVVGCDFEVDVERTA